MTMLFRDDETDLAGALVLSEMCGRLVILKALGVPMKGIRRHYPPNGSLEIEFYGKVPREFDIISAIGAAEAVRRFIGQEIDIENRAVRDIAGLCGFIFKAFGPKHFSELLSDLSTMKRPAFYTVPGVLAAIVVDPSTVEELRAWQN